jgi:hypothetical protein
MGRGSTPKLVGAIVAVEVVVLALAVVFFLHGEREKTFPAAVPIVATPQPAPEAVPVSVSVVVPVGMTRTAAALPRGGQATTSPAPAADKGYVG